MPHGWNSVDGQLSTFTGTKLRPAANGNEQNLSRGFGATLGVGTTDAWNTGETQNTDGPISYVVLFRSRATGGSGAGRIFEKGNSASGSEMLYVNSGVNAYTYQRYNSAGTKLCDSKVTAGGTPSDGLWHGLAFSQDGSVAGATSRVDGVPQTISTPGSAAGGATTTDPFWIGNRQSDSVRNFDGEIALVARIFGLLTPAQQRDFSLNPWLLFEPQTRTIFVDQAGAGAATHTTTGALTGPGTTVAGTAAHLTLHTTTGALTGPGATAAGTADHLTLHTTTGALTGQSATVAGTSVHTPLGHATTGVLTGQGAVVAGTAAHQHATTGVLTGPGATVAGTATHFALHTTTGVLTGPGAVVDGTAVHTGAASHDTSGVLTGPGAVVTGAAVHLSLHSTNGIVVGPGAAVAGVAAHKVVHLSTGALLGQGAVVVGAAAGPVILGVVPESIAVYSVWRETSVESVRNDIQVTSPS